MAEYVDRRRIYEEACEGCWYHGDEPGMCLNSEPCERLAVAFASARAADVAPVAHGHWDDDPDTYGASDGPKGKCMKSFETMCANDFCSYGEPKEGGDGE